MIESRPKRSAPLFLHPSDLPLDFDLIEKGISDPRKFGREISVIRYVLLLFIVSLLTSSAYAAKGVDPDADGRIVLDLSEEGKFLEREFAQENGLFFQGGDRSLGDEDGRYQGANDAEVSAKRSTFESLYSNICRLPPHFSQYEVFDRGRHGCHN